MELDVAHTLRTWSRSSSSPVRAARSRAREDASRRSRSSARTRTARSPCSRDFCLRRPRGRRATSTASHEESFYVLEGTLCLQLGDEEIDAAPGTYAFVPRGTPHTFRNTSPQPVRFLGVHSPGVEHMLIALAQATTPQEIGEISARFDTELA